MNKLMNKLLDALLTHAHHDHALDAMHFERAAMFAEDFDGFPVYTEECRGSAVIYVPERKLLLAGDDWNSCMRLFFPETLRAKEYRYDYHWSIEHC